MGIKQWGLVILASFSILPGSAQSKRIPEKIDRGIEKLTFVPKGTIFMGGTASYLNVNATDFKFLMLDNLKANGYILGAKWAVGYAFANDVAAGLAFDYSRTSVAVENVDLKLSEDMSFGLQDFSSIQQVYTGSAFMRMYINIGSSRRFGMFNDVKVSLGGGQGKILNGKGDALEGTYQKISSAGFLLQPGVAIFATDFMTVEASVGIFGVQYTRTEQISNQVYVGSFESVDASFKINLLSVGLGLSFYF